MTISILVTVASVGAFLIAYSGGISLPIELASVKLKTEADGRGEGKRLKDAPAELVLVYIGKWNCGPSNAPDMSELVGEIKDSLKLVADSLGYTFTTLGVATDRAVSDGTAHLQQFGTFDQMSAGAGWENIVASRYVRDVFPGPRATPQLVLTVRGNNDKGETKEPSARSADNSERLLVRMVGLDELRWWVQHGVPLPGISAKMET